MKKVLFTALLVLVFATNVFAFGDVTYEDNSTTNAPVAIAAPVASANAVAGAQATALANQQQGQLQGQVQGQQQGQGQNQIAVGKVKTTVKVDGDSYTVEKPYMNAPNLVQTDVPILQTGKIGDFTGAVPNIGSLKPLMNEKVIRVVAVYSGSIFWRIRLEDVVSKLIEKGSIYTEGKIRYSIWFKDSVTSGCVGLPMSGAASDNGMSGSIGSTNGYCQSTSNPQFIISFYEVE
jgi:hypothetical protein